MPQKSLTSCMFGITVGFKEQYYPNVMAIIFYLTT